MNSCPAGHAVAVRRRLAGMSSGPLGERDRGDHDERVEVAPAPPRAASHIANRTTAAPCSRRAPLEEGPGHDAEDRKLGGGQGDEDPAEPVHGRRRHEPPERRVLRGEQFRHERVDEQARGHRAPDDHRDAVGWLQVVHGVARVPEPVWAGSGARREPALEAREAVGEGVHDAR